MLSRFTTELQCLPFYNKLAIMLGQVVLDWVRLGWVFIEGIAKHYNFKKIAFIQ
jgi:hypothetical protein